MSMPKKLPAGKPVALKTQTFNTFVDTANIVRRQQHTGGGPTSGAPQNTGVILVKNNSGTDRAQFDVLGIDAPIILPTDNEQEFKQRVALSCITPASASHFGKFVVLQEPIANGKIGRGVISGVTVARVAVTTGEETHADIADATAVNLVAGYSGGSQILWLNGVTGTVLAVVRLGIDAPALKSFRITAAAQDGSNLRWTYTATEVAKTTAGYGGWTDKTGGLSGVTLYSLSEDQQTGTVTAGGVDTAGADYPAGFATKPIETGTRVYCKQERLSDGTVEWWIINFGTDDWGTCA